MNEITLDRCQPGMTGTIREVRANCNLQQRLLELGFVPGTKVSVIRFAPLGDPIQVEVRGYHLSLRRNEAKAVILQQDQ